MSISPASERPSISLAEFSRFVSHAPQTLRRLLAELHVGFPAPTDPLLRYFDLLTPDDYALFNRFGDLSPTRISELAATSSLGETLAHLPLALYRLYTEHMRELLAQEMGLLLPEEELLYTITSGTTPLQDCFAVGMAICSWDSQAAQLRFHRIDHNALFHACRNQLIGMKQHFPALADLYRHIIRARWPGWDRIPRDHLERLGITGDDAQL